MKTLNKIIIFLASLYIFALPVFAEWGGFKGSGGWGMNSPFNRMIDPNKIETIFGTVEKIDITTPHRMMSHGVYLNLKTEKELIQVILGPVWYIERLDFQLNVGDQVEVKGFPVILQGKQSMIAAEIKKGNDLLILRDIHGIPVWSRAMGKKK
jgi:hypothetical protein